MKKRDGREENGESRGTEVKFSEEREREGEEKEDVLEAERVNESSEWICYQLYSNSYK